MFQPSKDRYVIEDRSQLIYALTEAAALEHVLMCQYLFAGASLKTHVSELGSSPRRYHQIELIRYWKRKLFEIAREEMQHLSMAMNLLVAVGGSPTFQRPNFPNINLYYKEKLPDGTIRGLEMSLEKLKINRFVRLTVLFGSSNRIRTL
jgi:Ferritin-like